MRYILSILLIVLFIAGCTTAETRRPDVEVTQYQVEQPVQEKEEQVEIMIEEEAINTFHYQLQSTSYDQLKNLDADILVIDIDDSELTAEQVKSIKESGKMVLSYLSIGEAEDYRDYWQEHWDENPPSFLLEENPEWEGNYNVKYWDMTWQSIILNKLDDIIAKGYDGVYLDRVDAYQEYDYMSSVHSTEEMISFVEKISSHARSIKPDFKIITQNAVELYSDDEFQAAVDGLAREDLWFNDNSLQDTEDTATGLTYLRRALKDGKIVLVIDYPTQQSKICDFYNRCKEVGFTCTVSDRELTQDGPIMCTK